MTNKESKGIVMAATGESCRHEAVLSARSIKKNMPGVPVTLITNQPHDDTLFDEVIILPLAEDSHRGIKCYKPMALMKSPYEVTLFLDSDTYVCADCSELFDMAGFAELVLAHDTADASIPKLPETTGLPFYPYNSGVMAFNNSPRIKDFLKLWYEIVDKEYDEHPWDQRALMTAILSLKMTTYTLHPVYNCRTNFIVSLPQLPVKIIHGRNIDFEKTEKELNSVLKNRVWMPKRKKIMLKRKDTLLRKITRRLKNRIDV